MAIYLCNIYRLLKKKKYLAPRDDLARFLKQQLYNWFLIAVCLFLLKNTYFLKVVNKQAYATCASTEKFQIIVWVVRH